MNVLNDSYCCIYIALITLLLVAIYIIVGYVYLSADAINTRSLECQNVVVENTSINDNDGHTFFVNAHMILDTSNGNVIKKWGKLEPGDVVSMKYGKQTAVFC
jgi:hypothetical protein